MWPRLTGLLRELSKTSFILFFFFILFVSFYFGRKVILRLHNKLLRKHAEGVCEKKIMAGIKVHIASKC